MFIVQSYELQFPGLFLAAPISDMQKEAGSSKSLSLLLTSVNCSHIKYHLSWQGKVLSPECPLSPATASTAEQSSGLGPAWSLSQVGLGRWWPVGFAHIFRKEVANPTEMLLYIALKFIFFQSCNFPQTLSWESTSWAWGRDPGEKSLPPIPWKSLRTPDTPSHLPSHQFEVLWGSSDLTRTPPHILKKMKMLMN